MAGRMEYLLMGGDSSGSDDSDAETANNEESEAPTHAAVPYIVFAADPSSALPLKPGSKSELTTQSKNSAHAHSAVEQMPPLAASGKQGNDSEGAPASGVTAALTLPGRRGSVPMPIQVENTHAMAVPLPSSRGQFSSNNQTNSSGYTPPLMVHTSRRSSPGSAQQNLSQQQLYYQEKQKQQQQLARQQQHNHGAMPPPMQHGSVVRVPAPLSKTR